MHCSIGFIRCAVSWSGVFFSFECVVHGFCLFSFFILIEFVLSKLQFGQNSNPKSYLPVDSLNPNNWIYSLSFVETWVHSQSLLFKTKKLNYQIEQRILVAGEKCIKMLHFWLKDFDFADACLHYHWLYLFTRKENRTSSRFPYS